MERAAALPLIEDSMSMLDEMTTEGMFSYDKEDDLEVGNYDLDNLDSLLIGSRYL